MIGRKDYRRPGRRFMTRGLDRDGSAANFVETECVLISRPEGQADRMTLSAYVQTRGSIPLIWQMKPNLKWSPPVEVLKSFDTSKVSAVQHFQETKALYGK